MRTHTHTHTRTQDSIRYENSHEVHPTVYANIEKFKKVDVHGKKKGKGDQVFGECPALWLSSSARGVVPVPVA